MTFIHTTPWALYNEIDDYAATWLENLIARGLIAKGVVDRRSIEDIHPDDLRGFRQVHFFAGIAVWSYALRRAGVSDDTAIWSGSCPCQPFSAAGKGGGVDDERHLWPAFFHHIRERRPERVVGEQVASKDGLGWVDLVFTDMEEADYAIGTVDTCSAGSGAPHIRQRLRFAAYDLRSSSGRMADGEIFGRNERSRLRRRRQIERGWFVPAHNGSTEWLANGDGDEQREGRNTGGPAGERVWSEPSRRDHFGWMDNNNNKGLEGFGSRYQAEIGRLAAVGSVAEAGELDGMGNPCFDGDREHSRVVSGDEGQYEEWPEVSGNPPVSAGSIDRLADVESAGRGEQCADAGRCGERSRAQELEQRPRGRGLFGHNQPARPTNGFWSDADWLFCRDGKWRPVEPGTLPLAHGVAARVGRLRAYGNAVDAEATTDFLEAFLEKDTITLGADDIVDLASSVQVNSTNSGLFEDLLG